MKNSNDLNAKDLIPRPFWIRVFVVLKGVEKIPANARYCLHKKEEPL
jgi:hypothetical protein